MLSLGDFLDLLKDKSKAADFYRTNWKVSIWVEMLPIDFRMVSKPLEWAKLYSVHPVKAWDISEPYNKVRSNLGTNSER